ncbi:hypothetical protein [Gordonia liuliyuniae]|uniref:Methyl-accepting chemotaxis protein n=1 Tax=Gordonia liuliyuniae TaxID=2911517 RepID=A0ABS9IYC5_9ACTN|nr:hypothetical protein [Gordonia liuliyuniae]MCF8590457.1 hypothetical protein [Gordonia liuliyuniae]
MVGRAERSKDFAQEMVQSAASRVGNITAIITTAVVDVAREVGELITDGFEMRDAAKKAEQAQQSQDEDS